MRLLVERLGRPMNELGLPIGRRHELLCSAAERIWRPAAGCGLPSGASKSRWLIDYITATWEALDRPCHERAVEHALACATRRIAAHDDERAVLVHGDVHEWNALEAGDGFKLVGPDGLLAESEYDMGIPGVHPDRPAAGRPPDAGGRRPDRHVLYWSTTGLEVGRLGNQALADQLNRRDRVASRTPRMRVRDAKRRQFAQPLEY